MAKGLYTQNEMVWAFNEWQRRYVEDPEGFEHSWVSVMNYLDGDPDNNVNDHGVRQAAYFVSLLNE